MMKAYMKMNILRRSLWTLCTTILLWLPVSPTQAQNQGTSYGNTPKELVPYGNYQDAYVNFFDQPQPFTGSGRDKKPPAGLEEVLIGFLGPLDGDVLVPKGIQMLQGASLAVDEANARGGYKGLPYRIVEHNDVGLWGAAANEVVKMSDEGVWAFLGTIDDINSHVALRIALKLELFMVNTGDPDPTLTETRIPWLVRCISDDRQSSYALVEYIYKQKGYKRVAMIRSNNRYGRVGIMEFTDAALRVGNPLVLEVRYEVGEKSYEAQLERIRNSNPDAVVIWGNALESGLILNQMRKMGMNYPVIASDRVVTPEFLEITGKNAEGVVSTCQYNPLSDNPKLKNFTKNYRARYGQDPDVFAAHAYDGMNLLIEGIQKAGLNRTLIRDVLSDLNTFQGYEGVTGEIIFDASFNDIGAIWMAKVKDGAYEYSPASIE